MKVVYTVTVANAEDLRDELIAWLEARYNTLAEQRSDRSPAYEKLRLNAKLNEIEFIKNFITALSIQPGVREDEDKDEYEDDAV